MFSLFCFFFKVFMAIQQIQDQFHYLLVLLQSSDAIVIYLALTVVLVVILIAKWKLGKHRRIIKKNRKQGAEGEERAVKWPQKRGYKVSEQVSTDEYYRVDNEKVPYTIRPDIFAIKDDEQWVIEVKTGGAASIGNRDTRRQLREYAANFPDYRLGLFNANIGKEALQFIEFPKQARYAKLSLKMIFSLLAIGILTGIALAAYAQNYYHLLQ